MLLRSGESIESGYFVVGVDCGGFGFDFCWCGDVYRICSIWWCGCDFIGIGVWLI